MYIHRHQHCTELGELWIRITQPREGGRGQTCRSTGAPNLLESPAVALRVSTGGRYQQRRAAFPTVPREGGRGRTCRSTGAPNLTNSHAATFEGESHPGDQYSQPPVLRRVPPGGQYQQCVTAFLTEPREGGRGRTCRSTGAPNLPCSPITALRVSPGGQYQQPVAAFPNLSGEGGRGRTCRSTGAPNLPYSHAAALREFFQEVSTSNRSLPSQPYLEREEGARHAEAPVPRTSHTLPL
ncbi:hypothetical protein GBF38_019222 [Nibea albiflora]|uniref:Uncharacterized protein n=1 Tax=Nibea albiflora TaxID=240163 RepID=A0ACB7F177_NIBAL|nr:hypothetical protein GBF38_019222 [Nibea albiflora]